jgi:hypothetical protein
MSEHGKSNVPTNGDALRVKPSIGTPISDSSTKGEPPEPKSQLSSPRPIRALH